MAALAIKGHATRGKEVIEILEMLGGKDVGYSGIGSAYFYYIDEYGNITGTTNLPKDIRCRVITLEKFIEKYPYKVGDRVKHNGEVKQIISAYWDTDQNTVVYVLKGKLDTIFCYNTIWMHPYKEKEPMSIPETMKQITNIAKNLIKIDIPKGYEFCGVDDDAQQVVFEKIGCQYPKTYEECCEVLSLGENGKLYTKGYKASIIQDFHELFICRNAYWKIAGEQMGLGKPWKQDYNDRCFIIANNDGNIHTYEYHGSNNVILAFPTKEMRDAFYENFKDLIEQCEELL